MLCKLEFGSALGEFRGRKTGSGIFTLRPGVMDCTVSLAQVVMDLRTHLERSPMKASISSESV